MQGKGGKEVASWPPIWTSTLNCNPVVHKLKFNALQPMELRMQFRVGVPIVGQAEKNCATLFKEKNCATLFKEVQHTRHNDCDRCAVCGLMLMLVMLLRVLLLHKRLGCS
jgi:hypothetical protein